MTGARPFVSSERRRLLVMSRHRFGDDQPGVGDGRSGRSGDLDGRLTAVADSLVALHSSDPATVYLSLLARVAAATIDSIGHSLYRRRSLIRVHGMRRTLWVGTPVVAAEIVTASAGRHLAADRRRLIGFLEKAGVVEDGEQFVDAAAEELQAYIERHGPCETRAIGEALPHLTVGFDGAPGKSYSANIAAHTRVLTLLGCQGRILRGEPLGGWTASQYRWVTPERWLGEPLLPVALDDDAYPALERSARQAIIERYLHRFGPVTETDIAWWTGWPLGTARRSLKALGAVEVDLEDSDQPGWVRSDDFDEIVNGTDQATEDGTARAETLVAAVPGLDPSTMGWKHRDWYLAADHADQLFDRNGNGGPALWLGGRIVGGWAQRDDGELVYKLLADVGVEARAAIEAELDRLARRLDGGDDGPHLFKVRFSSPLNRELRR